MRFFRDRDLAIFGLWFLYGILAGVPWLASANWELLIGAPFYFDLLLYEGAAFAALCVAITLVAISRGLRVVTAAAMLISFPIAHEAAIGFVLLGIAITTGNFAP